MEYTFYMANLFIFLVPLYIFIGRWTSKRVPPGSLGLPIVGQTLDFLKAMRANKEEEWFQERIDKYGPVWKAGLFGKPTVFLHGQKAHKFVYSCDGNTLANRQATSIRRILGEKNLFEVSPEDHKRVREVLMTFLKPETLKQCVEKIDEDVRMHLNKHWEGKQHILVMPLMHTLKFDIICSTLFNLERGERRELLLQHFRAAMEGMLAVPINLPFTRYCRSLRASAKAKAIIMDLITEKRAVLAQNGSSSRPTDLITALLSAKDERGCPVMSDQEIVDNTFFIMIPERDTSAFLLALLVRILAKNPSVYENVCQEQEDIAKSKGREEALTWEDLTRMKYTWRVVMEALRMYPPVPFSVRQTVKDIEYEGYVIPKGWQVIWAFFTTHMDEKLYPDPSKFDPSRYEQGKRTPFSFMAFGGGPRSCPGNEFARIDTLVMIHYVVTKFRWKLSLEDESFRRDPTPVFNLGMPVQLEPKCRD